MRRRWRGTGASPGAGFAANCLLARRLVERGVRFVQLVHGGFDHHGGRDENPLQNLPVRCREVDQGSAALVLDLEQRGLLESTLVVWGGEFKRTPMLQGPRSETDLGRDHQRTSFTMWLAGGGVKHGFESGGPTSSGCTWSRTSCTCTTCRRRCWTCSGSITSGWCPPAGARLPAHGRAPESGARSRRVADQFLRHAMAPATSRSRSEPASADVVFTMRFLRKRVLVAALSAIVLTGLGAFAVHRMVEVRWDSMTNWARDARQRFEAHDFRRPPLWGESQPGSAFASYRQASELAQPLLARDDKQLQALFRRPEEVSPEDAAALRARWAPAVAAMREGAHREDARTPVQFEKGFEVKIQNLLVGRWLVNMAVIEARELRAAGNGRAAVELLLDAAAMGADMIHSPLLIDQMIGSALVVIATNEAWPAKELGLLDREALDLLATGLARLDAGLPVSLGYEGELVVTAHAFLNAGQNGWPKGDGTDPLSRPGWCFGFSQRWMLASGFHELLAMHAALTAGAGEPWPAREQRFARLDARYRAERNPVLQCAWPNVASAERTLRETLTMVRLLRLSVDTHRGVPRAPLGDPLGTGPIGVAETEGGVRFTSAGARGRRHLERNATPR